MDPSGGSNGQTKAEKKFIDEACLLAWGVEAKAWIPKVKGERGAQFASTLLSGSLTLELPVIIKRKPFEEFKRRTLQSDNQFHNELLAYRSLLPGIGASSFAPRLYGGASGVGESDFVTLERKEDFLPPSKPGQPFMDEDHLKLALGRLGQFHGLSYNAKGSGFLPSAANSLKYVGFSTRAFEEYAFLETCLKRAIEPVLKENPSRSSEILELLAVIDSDLQGFVKALDSGSEPTAVLCHGDFCSNNLLYKYKNGTKKPIDLLFIDFQTTRYSSPAIDLSFFLYMNTSEETRSKSWENLLEIYFEALESTLNIPGPGREALMKELSIKALYGLLHCSFFLPFMLLSEPPSWTAETEEVFLGSSPEGLNSMITIGGDDATTCLNQVFSHMLQKGFVRAFLDYYKNKR